MDQATHETIEELRRAHRRLRTGWTVAAVAVLVAWATPAFSMTEVPHHFGAGTPARANEVNENFDYLAGIIDTNIARLDAIEARDDFVPAGTIAFFATTTCPTGWSDYAGANGRYIVGVTGDSASGVTVGGTVGAPMDDLEDRTHTHTIAHRHEWTRYDASAHAWSSYDSATAGDGRVVLYDHGNGINGEGSGFYPLAAASGGSYYTDDPSVSDSGTAATSAVAPYIQLRACQKM